MSVQNAIKCGQMLQITGSKGFISLGQVAGQTQITEVLLIINGKESNFSSGGEERTEGLKQDEGLRRGVMSWGSREENEGVTIVGQIQRSCWEMVWYTRRKVVFLEEREAQWWGVQTPTLEHPWAKDLNPTSSRDDVIVEGGQVGK